MSAIRYEWKALLTLTSVRWILIVAPLAVAALSMLTLLLLGQDRTVTFTAEESLVMLARLNAVSLVAVAVLAAVTVSADVRNGMVLAALLRSRGREQTWLARLAVAVVAAAGMAGISMLVIWAAVRMMTGPVAPGDAVLVASGATVQAVGWGVLAAGLASVIRRVPLAVATLVVWAYAAEPMARSVLAAAFTNVPWVSDVFPMNAGSSLVRGGQAAGIVETPSLPWLGSAGIFLGTAAIIGVAGLISFRHADLSPAT